MENLNKNSSIILASLMCKKVHWKHFFIVTSEHQPPVHMTRLADEGSWRGAWRLTVRPENDV